MWGLLGYARKAEHRFCRDNLSAFMDGQLAARDRERVGQHLDRCQACQQELAGLQRTVSLLRALPRLKAPRSFAIPRSVPAPALPFWMRPWAYGALRVASAATAVLLVVALAGSALVSPAAYSRDAVRMMAAKSASEPEMMMRGQAEVEAPLAGPPPIVGAPALGTPAPSVLAAPTEAAPLAELAAASPTLTAEEALRATAAPAGKGGGASETATPPAAEATAVAEATQGTAPKEPVEADTPPTVAAAVSTDTYGMATPGPAQPAPEDVNQAWPSEDGARAPRAYGLFPWPRALWLLRERVGGYPWGWWAVGSGALLAVLLAATFWVRARRARWS